MTYNNGRPASQGDLVVGRVRVTVGECYHAEDALAALEETMTPPVAPPVATPEPAPASAPPLEGQALHQAQYAAAMKPKGMAASVAAILIACLLLAFGFAAKADPQSYSSLAVTNINNPLLDERVTAANTDTNVNATYTIVQNANAFLTVGINVLGTNDPVGKLVLAHNFEAGDGNYTTTMPLTNSFPLTAASLGLLGGGGTNSTGVYQAWLSYTNFTGLKHGRVDCVYVTGATNSIVTFITIGWKTVTPY